MASGFMTSGSAANTLTRNPVGTLAVAAASAALMAGEDGWLLNGGGNPAARPVTTATESSMSILMTSDAAAARGFPRPRRGWFTLRRARLQARARTRVRT